MAIEPHLWTNDFQRSVDWYLAVGFEAVQWFPSEEAPTWCQLSFGDASVMVAVTPDPTGLADNQQYLGQVTDRVGKGGPVSLYLHVEDADAVFRTVTGNGLMPIEDLWDAWWGGRQFSIADPDGNWWTVFQSVD